MPSVAFTAFSVPSPAPGEPAPGDALRLGVVAVRDRSSGRWGSGDGRARRAAFPRGRGLGCRLLGRHHELRSVVVGATTADKGAGPSVRDTSRPTVCHVGPRGLRRPGSADPPGYGAVMSDSPPVDHREPVVVATYVDLGEAEIAQAKLRAFGIEAEILDQAEGGVIPPHRAAGRHRGVGAGRRRGRRVPHPVRHDRGLSQAGRLRSWPGGTVSHHRPGWRNWQTLGA